MSVDESRWFSLSLDIDRNYKGAKDMGVVIETHRLGVEALAAALGPPEVYSEGWIYYPDECRFGRSRGKRSNLAEPYAVWTLGKVIVRRVVTDKMGMMWFTRISL